MKPTLFSLLVLGCAGSCAAQIQPIVPKKGAYSVSFSAAWFRDESGTIQSTFFATPAYFVTDHLELRLPLGFARLVGTNEFIYGLGARWHFGDRRRLLDPFVGVVSEHASATRFREDMTALQLGVHYFVASNVALTTLVSFAHDRANGVSQDSTHFVTGFTVFFADR